MQALSRARFTDSDNESPVVIGTKMVERVVNMRKLAPPKNEDHHSAHNNSHGKSSSSDSSGFGLTLSKKSLDMAMRHMVRQCIPLLICCYLKYKNDYVALIKEYEYHRAKKILMQIINKLNLGNTALK